MGLRTLAEKGCGLTDALGEYMKMQLLKDQLQLSREELTVNKGLRDAQAQYYLANAAYLGRSEGKNTKHPGPPKPDSTAVTYLQNQDGTWVAAPSKLPGVVSQPTSVNGIGPGATRPGTTQATVAPGAPQPFMDRANQKLGDFFFGGDAGTTTPPVPTIRRFDKDGNPI